MAAKIVEFLSSRTGAERGALTAAAGALLVLLLAATIPPTRLPTLVGPDPMPQALALISASAAMAMGAEVGRRAVRYRAARARRLVVVLVWTFVAYLASVTVAVDVLVVLDEGPGTLADPFLLIVRGLVVCLLLVPWAVVPVALTAAVLERWTRSAPPRRGGPGGPKGGTRAARPPVDAVDGTRGAA